MTIEKFTAQQQTHILGTIDKFFNKKELILSSRTDVDAYKVSSATVKHLIDTIEHIYMTSMGDNAVIDGFYGKVFKVTLAKKEISVFYVRRDQIDQLESFKVPTNNLKKVEPQRNEASGTIGKNDRCRQIAGASVVLAVAAFGALTYYLQSETEKPPTFFESLLHPF